MRRLQAALLLLAALAIGFLLGTQAGPAGPSDLTGEAERDELREEITRLHLALGERGPRVRDPDAATGAPLLGTHPDGGPDEDGTRPVLHFDVTAYRDADRAFRRLIAHAATLLERGEDGHMALLEALDATFARKPGADAVARLLGGDQRGTRYLYPVLRFALQRQDQVAEMTETVFRVLAREPQRLAAIDAQVLKLFTGRIALMLPGIVGAKRLATFEGHARTVLATPSAKQPAAVQRVRGEVQAALDSWGPPLAPEEALARLREPGASAERVAALLARLTPAMREQLDLDALLGPLLERDGFRVLGLLGGISLHGHTIEKLDVRVLRAVASGKQNHAFVQYYLRSTERGAWPRAREFIENGFQQGGARVVSTLAEAALGLDDGPDRDWIRWVLKSQPVSSEAHQLLRERLR